MTDKETEKKVEQLQLLEQNLQAFLVQKQQFQAQEIEVDSALNEIKDKKDAYKIVGNIMINVDAKQLNDELSQKKESLNIRIKNLEKQEEKIREKLKKIQAEVLKNIKTSQ
ncbi:prefoldin subunit beta [Candidatus Woesearchaeota archaeon]|nr:prefoldin subunit beta [Candidatus Woesearchaeota archaeon]|tara:strand:+ start:11451 stop:11783 length:333 start_codon:yes stop_codon:yes gene_type:complete